MKSLCKNMVTHLQKMGSTKGSLTVIICLFLLISPGLMAANHGSTVTFSSWNNQDFILEIGNERYHSQGEITLRNVRPGKVRIKMFRERNQHSSHYGSQGRGTVLYNGFIDVPRNSKLIARVNNNRRMKVSQVNQRNRPVMNKPRRPSNNQCGNNGFSQNPHQEPVNSHSFEPYSYDHTGMYGGASCMSNDMFLDLLYEIDQACFSEDKKRVARMALRHQHISAEQLEDLIRAMDFDSDELEIAQLAYPKVMDKENIWKVYDAFSFRSTARDFEKFVCQY